MAKEVTIGEIEMEKAGIANVMKLWETDIKRMEDALKAEMDAAKLPMQVNVQLAEAGFKAGLNELDFIRGTEEREASLDLITAKIQKLQVETAAELAAAAGGGLKAGDVSISTNTSGLVTAVNKVTGKVLWTNQIGRAGTASPNINVTPIADPITGVARYTQIIDRDTGQIKYIDNTTGKEVPASQVVINPPDIVDPIESWINEIFEEMNITGGGGGSTPIDYNFLRGESLSQ